MNRKEQTERNWTGAVATETGAAVPAAAEDEVTVGLLLYLAVCLVIFPDSGT